MSQRQSFPLYADLILPLALPKNYTYGIPEELCAEAAIGKRAEVSFGKKKIYAGIIAALHRQAPSGYAVKPIQAVLDAQPLISERQLRFWSWMADYYLCTPGEVMLAAVPAGLRLESETVLQLQEGFDGNLSELTADELLVVQLLTRRRLVRLEDLQREFPRSRLYALLDGLLHKQIITLSEKLSTYQPPQRSGYVLHSEYADTSRLTALFDELEKRAPRQSEALMQFLHLSRRPDGDPSGWVERNRLLQHPRVSAAAVQALLEKKILVAEKRVAQAAPAAIAQPAEDFALSKAQQSCWDQLQRCLQEKTVALLHGVTGSGKTHLYIRLIEERLQQQHQVLYMLPEIALTAQMIARLRRSFGDRIAVYHSRLSPRERLDTWKRLREGTCQLVLGARSALFLPWQRLGLIIVDEEHDPSYKQDERAPHYQGRDAAIYLAHLFADVPCRVLLGSATPSLESYTHARKGKYGLVHLNERYGDASLPEIVLVNVRQATKEKRMHSLFSDTLLQEIETCLGQQRQVILFRNRRGYAPSMQCEVCGWMAQCPHCDVSLTYHKFRNQLQCHYCGYRRATYTSCAACGSPRLIITGYGTQKVEEELHVFFPKAVIGRLDYDTASARQGMQRIISSFEQGMIHILVGTQLVTKGLDFDRVALVGILDADQLFGFTDFRSMERGFQLLLQVSGRAGRRDHPGKVIVQTRRPELALYDFVMRHDFEGFYEEEIQRRQTIYFPPFCRLILLTCIHRQQQQAEEAARRLASGCSTLRDVVVLGPAYPPVMRINNRYRMQVLLKVKNRQQAVQEVKNALRVQLQELAAHQQLRSVQVLVDVDP
ncbi:MAG: primosomal protein N' [Chitinophagales bacterium]|nr:primosomal protein N' [Chitinophagales bacterium]MDW8393050.1 primosomal protein N' [Chitinophagales bacterium]